MTAATTIAISVTEYAAVVARKVRAIPGAVIEGEVQKPKTTQSGMLCFDLTDGETKFACKVFRGQRGGLDHDPEHGELVQVSVERPDFWPVAGKLDLIVTDIRLAGEGELRRRREVLLAKLQAEGLCDPARRLPLPRLPRAVGVIAAPGSDGISDVVRALHDRFPPVDIVACPSLVQGKGAPRQIIDALARLQEHPRVDVIVVARGGGSVQDLLPFDDEGLCRAMFACDKPVVAAIGHTDNIPVCNHVTHSASTPSRSHELVVPSQTEMRQELGLARQALAAVPALLERQRERLAAAAIRLGPSGVVDREAARLRDQLQRLCHAQETFFTTRGQRLAELTSVITMIPHRLPAASSIVALGSKLDSRAASFFTSRARQLDGERGRIGIVHQRLDRVEALIGEHRGQVARGTRRQLADHERDYGRAITRLLRQISAAIARRVAREHEVSATAHRQLKQRVERRMTADQRDYGRAMARLIGEARSAIGRRLEREGERLGVNRTRLRERVERRQQGAERDLRLVVTQIAARDHRRDGFPLAAGVDGQPIRSVSALRGGQRLNLRFGDGLAETIVDNTEEDTSHERAQ